MTRVLFVDDNPLVLQGLQRMLRPLRGEWEMTFVESGAVALALMAQRPFDVVVSDMRMPAMNGAQLLNEVMRRYPQTIRLILSGHADQDLILKCVGSTHQYLAKPCDADALKATVQRAAALGVSLRNEAVKRLVTQMDRLPSLPTLYLELLERLQRPETTAEELARVIERDPGMAAQVLKLANSAYFGRSRPVADPFEAVIFLGLDTLKSLVLCLHAFSQYEGLELVGLSLDQLWGHSLEVAANARRLVWAREAPRKMADEAFAAGLLHDVGKLVLASNCRPQYQEVERQVAEGRGDALAAETAVFGCTHADVGGYLLGLWGLPVPVVEAIALHHEPGRTVIREFSPVTAVHVANVLAHRPPRDEPSSNPALAAPLSDLRGASPALAAIEAPLPACAHWGSVTLATDYLRELHLPLDLDAWRQCLDQEVMAETCA